MNEKQKKKISKFLSLVLRHKPEVIGISLDEDGWVAVETLRRACAENEREFSKDELKEVVETNDKKRFSFDESGTKIRANQGHSLKIELDLEEQFPPILKPPEMSECVTVNLLFFRSIRKKCWP